MAPRFLEGSARLSLFCSAGVAPDLPLFYKPDIYTHLDIYSKNELGLKPSILRDGPRDEGRLPSASY